MIVSFWLIPETKKNRQKIRFDGHFISVCFPYLATNKKPRLCGVKQFALDNLAIYWVAVYSAGMV